MPEANRNVNREKAMKIDSMKHIILILAVSLCCFSCSEKSDNSGTKDGPAASSVGPGFETNSPKTGENVLISTTNGKSADLSQAWFYTTNGNSRLQTFPVLKDRQVISSKTVAEAGKLKWMDQFSYNQDSKNLVEMRRTKADGRIFQVLYNYSNDGRRTKTVIGPDGRQVPAENQDSSLNE
jgi:hypothetical protein